MKNLSDGKADGIVIMYALNGTVYPTLLNEEQSMMLDLFLSAIFNEENHLMVISDLPQGKIGMFKDRVITDAKDDE